MAAMTSSENPLVIGQLKKVTKYNKLASLSFYLNLWLQLHLYLEGGAVVWWLARWTSDLEVGGLTLVSAVVLLRQTRCFIPNCLFSSPGVYKWILLIMMLGLTMRWTSIASREKKQYSHSPPRSNVSGSFSFYFARFHPQWIGNMIKDIT